MDAGLFDAAKNAKREESDPHDWNSYENYRQIHDSRLNTHTFVDHSANNTLEFEFFEQDGYVYLWIYGEITCKHNITLHVDKILETRQVAKGRIQVRGFYYCYNASKKGKSNILRYDNAHDFDDYHKHTYDTSTGKHAVRENLTRAQFPTLADVLDEIEKLMG